jgi:Tfp pilus assembly protein PilX
MKLPPSTRARRQSTDDGSILMAVMILMIVLTLVTAVAVQVIGNEFNVSARQSAAQAVSLADAGISDALFRLDQGATAAAGYSSGTGTYSTFCVGVTGCASTSLPTASGASYKAIPNNSTSPTSWTIYAKATTGSQSGAVTETITRTSMYPFALFTQKSMTLNGTSNMTWTTYTSDSSIPDTSQDVGIGSDGALSCHGNLATNVMPSYYQANGSTNGTECGDPTTTDYVYPTPTAPSSYTACPNNGNFGSGASPSWPTLGSANTTTTILCTVPVTISGQLTILGEVDLYVILTPPAPSGQTQAIGWTTGSYINDGYDYCLNVLGKSNGYCTNQYGVPVSTNFQVHTNSTLDVGDTSGHGFYFAGILDAPQAGMTENGCKGVFYGAIILNSFTCNGGSSGFTLNYDEALTQQYGPWVISGYREIPPRSFTVP